MGSLDAGDGDPLSPNGGPQGPPYLDSGIVRNAVAAEVKT